MGPPRATLLSLLLATLLPVAPSSPSAPSCRLKTVTVSTLPVLRESALGWGGAPPPGVPGTPTDPSAPGLPGPADSQLLLFVRSELPGYIAVQDDLDNTELPYFTLGKRVPGCGGREICVPVDEDGQTLNL
ncbi:hypothetical protein NDU88_012119 [Pleurodeles waltl]|uniref:Uncharacterized protein n=1 Tax=Pleurodeles waltl TaxID=8319 RepID=A0AAV7QZ86_PLEWA|nr:hypothetical protein NDU88_012119 [Pleurodeles waltl]